MISQTTRSRNPAGHAGLLKNLLALASALTDFFESRFTLLARESRTALVQLLVLTICVGLALVLCVFGCVFLIASAIVGLAHLFGISSPSPPLFSPLPHFIIPLPLLPLPPT